MRTGADILPDRYRDPELLARGGMGDVYRALDESLRRDVAVKVLADRFAADEDSRTRFSREALAAARLSGHPHAITIFDVGEHAERPFIVMEHLTGGSLAERAAGRPVPPARALPWLEATAAALDEAHRQGVVHRDVKPANLLFDGSDTLKVADFGVASAAGLTSVTVPGTVLGTAGYLSPEQATGRPATPASDRYALAVVAYELLAGRRPFARDSSSAEALAHTRDPIPSLCAEQPGLPCELDPVFARALAKDPARRYPSCRDFVAALHEALDVSAGATRIRATLRPSRSWVVPFALLVAGVALAGILAAWALTRGGSPQTIVRTVTTRGRDTTVQQTVTQTRPQTQPAPATPGPSGGSLNDAGYAKMRTGDLQGALPLLEQAVAKLQGSGQLTEAYASYNLAYTRFGLGRCDGVLDLLDRAESIEGDVGPIQSLRAHARHRCS
jgi:eukaryotic-like serine/threonine-protein kinase